MDTQMRPKSRRVPAGAGITSRGHVPRKVVSMDRPGSGNVLLTDGQRYDWLYALLAPALSAGSCGAANGFVWARWKATAAATRRSTRFWSVRLSLR